LGAVCLGRSKRIGLPETLYAVGRGRVQRKMKMFSRRACRIANLIPNAYDSAAQSLRKH
jgi:hypothetical protein